MSLGDDRSYGAAVRHSAGRYLVAIPEVQRHSTCVSPVAQTGLNAIVPPPAVAKPGSAVRVTVMTPFAITELAT